MADSTTWVLVGIGIGVGITVGAMLLFQQRAAAADGEQAGLVTHDVHRNEQGRITSVETLRQPLGGGGIQQTQTQPQVTAHDG